MESPLTLPFERFWDWLLGHPNCILRAGTPEAVLYDDEDLHWHFASEGVKTLLVQVVRGKLLLGELLLDPEHITYVQEVPSENEGEFVFELIVEAESERFAAYFFVLAHGFDGEGDGDYTPARVH